MITGFMKINLALCARQYYSGYVIFTDLTLQTTNVLSGNWKWEFKLKTLDLGLLLATSVRQKVKDLAIITSHNSRQPSALQQQGLQYDLQ